MKLLGTVLSLVVASSASVALDLPSGTVTRLVTLKERSVYGVYCKVEGQDQDVGMQPEGRLVPLASRALCMELLTEFQSGREEAKFDFLVSGQVVYGFRPYVGNVPGDFVFVQGLVAKKIVP